MKLYKKLTAKLFFKQYTIGVVEAGIADILAQKKIGKKVTWYKLDNYRESLADPFIIDSKDDALLIIAEIFTTGEHNGRICLINYNRHNGFSEPRILHDEGVHLSYPCVFKEDGKSYVLLTKINGSVDLYEFDLTDESLKFTCTILNEPLIDATLMKKDDKYWLFGTFIKNVKSDNLYIFSADNLSGPYLPHSRNPVKIDLNGCRSAGNLISVGEDIYRPAQNCSVYYGESIVINKVIALNDNEYVYEDHMLLESNRDDEYNFGIHTLNGNDRFIVVDGQKGHFQPVQQVGRACMRAYRYLVEKKAKLLFIINISQAWEHIQAIGVAD